MVRYRLVQEDLACLFEKSGYGVIRMDPAHIQVEFFREVCATRRPKLLFSVNYSPGLALLASMCELPYVSWTVDPLPEKRLAVRTGTQADQVMTFSFCPKVTSQLRGLGLAKSHYLPLAAPIGRRRPVLSTKALEPYVCTLSFVGNSLAGDFSAIASVCEAYDISSSVEAECYDSLKQLAKRKIENPEFGGVKSLQEVELPPEFSQIEKPADQSDLVGGINGYLAHQLRVSRVEALQGIPVEVWGDAGWETHAGVYRGIADHGEELTHIYCGSQLNLDLPRIYDRSSLKMRIFDVLACGGTLLTERSGPVEAMFTTGEHLFTYTNIADLRSQVETLQHEPEKCREVGAAGMKLVVGEHTLAHRFESIVEACKELGWL